MRLWTGWMAVALALVTAVPGRAQMPAKAPAVAANPPKDASAATGGGAAASAYTVGGIAVDVVARTIDEARDTAYHLAQRQAWPQLWERMTGQGASNAPRLADGALDAMTAGIEIQGERFSTTRYIATLGVVFDRTRAADYFTAVTGAVHSEPMLLLPVFHDAGVQTVYERKTPWLAAWQRYSEAISPIDYVLASSAVGDTLVLTSYQMRRPDRPLWRNLLNRFKAVDVLVAEAKLTRQYPGGPIDALFIARHGPDGTELGRVALRTNATAGLDAMLDTGVRQIDAIYAEALRDGRLRAEPDLSADLAPIMSASPILDAPDKAVSAGGFEVLAATPDSASWLAIEAALKATPGVSGVTLTSLSLGGSSRIVIRGASDRAMLAYELDQKGLRLVQSTGGLLLRRREPGETPLPRPVVAVPAVETEAETAPVALRSEVKGGEAKAVEPKRAESKAGPQDLMPVPPR